MFRISIHAPSWERRRILPCFALNNHFNPRSLAGATVKRLYSSLLSLRISIHAPLRERLHFFQYRRVLWEFQSTLPYGSDLDVLFLKPCPPISIHAPLRERPIILFLLANVERDFNPRSLTGATPKAGYTVLVLKRFQSTLPHGSDAWSLFNGYVTNEFQSTLPHGSDTVAAVLYCIIADFNPRSLTGATQLVILFSIKSQDFNPRSLAGATANYAAAYAYGIISIHAPLRERRVVSYIFALYRQFQSTLPRGSDVKIL